MWLHSGKVRLTQQVLVTSASAFHLHLSVHAQVCDDATCHEFRAVVDTDGRQRSFFEFSGRFDDVPLTGR